ncbi:MAG: plasma-membrane proton-efflux P-type ATPase [Gammaproteobacteria bacterium]
MDRASNHTPNAKGLTSAEAAQRLAAEGPNAVSEEQPHPLRVLLQKFWAPVPWMLEATIVLQLALGKAHEAAIISFLLIFNVVLAFVQEGRANRALALLKQRLSVQARVYRDDHWKVIPARELVSGDVVHLRMGDLAPADIRLLDGNVLLDQSALTGESLPVEASSGSSAYAGSIVKRGEATGEVTATGGRTYFGKTAELVRSARTVSHLQTTILTIVKYLIVLDLMLVAALFGYALAAGMSLSETLPFALILLVASVPVALPATFTLATALGALELSKRGVLVTRLSAIEEAAAMNVLATDKTGTITLNQLAVAEVSTFTSYSENQVLRLAALACDEATQDPIDMAILEAAHKHGLLTNLPTRQQFIPFDTTSKRSEAQFEQDGQLQRTLKGAPPVIAALCAQAPALETEVERLSANGYRVLAVASGNASTLQVAGLVALQDPPRPDSRKLVQSLKDLGVRVMMVTGDGLATARAVASEVDIGERACRPDSLHDSANHAIDECDVFAGVYPEDKFHLVQQLQRSGHVSGMTGDGVNDAPALKQAEVGIAVSNASDVAKAAASMVLTNPGLIDVLAAVKVSRRIYQRMLTYTLNKIIKTLEIAIFLSVGVMLTGVFVVTPILIVLLLFTNDFVTMSIASDRVAFSKRPERWHIPTLMLTAAILAALVLVLSFSVFFVGRDWLHLPLPQLQTLIFVMLVFTGQGNVYLVRERRHLWHSRPGHWLVLASLLDIIVVSLFASFGILMTPISPLLVLALLVVVVVYLLLLDFVKIRIFRHLHP